jgi:hypothetical protein
MRIFSPGLLGDAVDYPISQLKVNVEFYVPVIFMGEGIRAGEYHEKIAVNDIPPTLATILRVEEPSGSIGRDRILSEIFQYPRPTTW